MKPTALRPAARCHGLGWLLASSVFCAASTGALAQTVLDFEGVPSDFNYDGLGFNLGGYYAGEPGGPTFGPQATVIAEGGSLNHLVYPPPSGIGMLWGEGFDIELAFTVAPARSVSLYYRSNADVSLFAYDPSSALLGSVSGPASLASDPEGFLTFNAGGGEIAHLLIVGPSGAFLIDDVSYEPVPEPGQIAFLTGLGLAAFACWRRRRTWESP